VGITGVFDFSPTDHNGLDTRAVTMVQIVDGQWRVAR
jgi:branched-chain amino acid transport system substrate-binding protein